MHNAGLLAQITSQTKSIFSFSNLALKSASYTIYRFKKLLVVYFVQLFSAYARSKSNRFAIYRFYTIQEDHAPATERETPALFPVRSYKPDILCLYNHTNARHPFMGSCTFKLGCATTGGDCLALMGN